jgi:hypothetical protein
MVTAGPRRKIRQLLRSQSTVAQKNGVRLGENRVPACQKRLEEIRHRRGNGGGFQRTVVPSASEATIASREPSKVGSETTQIRLRTFKCVRRVTGCHQTVSCVIGAASCEASPVLDTAPPAMVDRSRRRFGPWRLRRRHDLSIFRIYRNYSQRVIRAIQGVD